MANQIEKESTKLADVEWTQTGVLVAKFYDGIEERFDPRLTTVSVQSAATKYGFAVRFQRLGSLEVKDYPTRKSRAEEYRRRFRELREHYYSGSDAWDIPKARGQAAISEADLMECLDRCYPGQGQVLFNLSLAEAGGDLGKVRETWLTTAQVATAWVKLQAERRTQRTETLGDADAMVKRLMAMSQPEGGGA